MCSNFSAISDWSDRENSDGRNTVLIKVGRRGGGMKLYYKRGLAGGMEAGGPTGRGGNGENL